MIQVITPVGTSMYENYMRAGGDDLKVHYDQLKDEPGAAWNDDGNARRIRAIRDKLQVYANKDLQASAEIASILKIREHLGSDIYVRLLSTDTLLSRLAAEVIVSRFDKLSEGVIAEYDSSVDMINSLQIKDQRSFERDGIPNLTKRVLEVVLDNVDWSEGKTEGTVMNLTGGYKALIPFLTLIGQVYKLPLFYLFENTDHLITIPQIPMSIDWGVFEKHSSIIDQLYSGVDNWGQLRWTNDVGEDLGNCIWSDGDLAELNAVGKMLYDRYRTFFSVSVPKQWKYFDEEPSKKKLVEKAIITLYSQLIQIENFAIYTHPEIKHAEVAGGWVYKHTNPQQIRIHYNYDGNRLSVYNYFFIDSPKMDKYYSNYLVAEWPSIKNREQTTISLKE